MVTEKSFGAYKTISEVSKSINVPSHVLRFWETKFSQVKPIKRSGGRRYYRSEDIQTLSSIRELLYNEGYTIKGAQKVLKSHLKKGKTTDNKPSALNKFDKKPDGEGFSVEKRNAKIGDEFKVLELLRNSEKLIDKMISKSC